MGCNVSKKVEVITEGHKGSSHVTSVHPVHTSPKPDRKPLMNKEHMSLVKETWSKMLKTSGLALLGKQIFLRVFELRPGVKAIFPAFSKLWGDSLIRHPQFQIHAERFMMVINSCVINCESVKTEHSEMLYNLGRAHASFEGFHRDNFDIFRKSILFVFQQELKQEYNEEVETAWRKLLDFVLSTQSKGYEAELKALSKKDTTQLNNDIQSDTCT